MCTHTIIFTLFKKSIIFNKRKSSLVAKTTATARRKPWKKAIGLDQQNNNLPRDLNDFPICFLKHVNARQWLFSSSKLRWISLELSPIKRRHHLTNRTRWNEVFDYWNRTDHFLHYSINKNSLATFFRQDSTISSSPVLKLDLFYTSLTSVTPSQA